MKKIDIPTLFVMLLLASGAKKETLETKDVPEINKYCEKCLYLDTGKKFI